jgi:hypothetical protein
MSSRIFQSKSALSAQEIVYIRQKNHMFWLRFKEYENMLPMAEQKVSLYPPFHTLSPAGPCPAPFLPQHQPASKNEEFPHNHRDLPNPSLQLHRVVSESVELSSLPLTTSAAPQHHSADSLRNVSKTNLPCKF